MRYDGDGMRFMACKNALFFQHKLLWSLGACQRNLILVLWYLSHVKKPYLEDCVALLRLLDSYDSRHCSLQPLAV